jgi:hypothetical protein
MFLLIASVVFVSVPLADSTSVVDGRLIPMLFLLLLLLLQSLE